MLTRGKEKRRRLKAAEGKARRDREREREREARRLFPQVTQSVASAVASAAVASTIAAASGRHSGDVVNEQSFEPNMLSPRSGEPIFNLSRCGARASASLPGMPDGQTGTNFRTGTDRLAPYHLLPADPRILNMLLYQRHRFICGCLADWQRTTDCCRGVWLSLAPEFPSSLPGPWPQSSKVHMHHAAAIPAEMSPFCSLQIADDDGCVALELARLPPRTRKYQEIR